ncbi:patatin-like phospholipase family protein [Phenylobacterium sp.]|uniref:patatin-like phospholipase family protein n=1 Tax=Phenylobacterium sp. TaxID=1871053 RepID=UPI0027305EBD|nr:patatin-like phospholipase family protein [Phenylobacterium sp.]MDP2212403.1 patatin-like phospholipase family protein [Phenylobacterium sp.]
MLTRGQFRDWGGPAVAMLAGVLALTLAGCGSISRPEAEPARIGVAAAASSLDAFRFVADSEGAGQAFLNAWQAQREAGGAQSVTALAVSGGGANGAFGAGVLVGWTQTGERPVFDLVTGVSTGALISPFAFLGSDWDERLAAAYRDEDASRLTAGRWGALRRPSLYGDRSLRALVGKYVQPDLLTAIAAEHQAGRRLLVATTNLDAQATILWDMGAIALAGQAPGQEAAALALFRNVLVASASIPGVFPPVMMEAAGPFGTVSEMHVDGGVSTPFVLAPAGLTFWRPEGVMRPKDLYVIINGEIEPRRTITKGATLPILMRSFDTLSKSDLRAHLIAAVAFASRNEARLRYAAIPTALGADSLAFDRASMQRLFDAGLATGADGTAFEEVIPEAQPPPVAP